MKYLPHVTISFLCMITFLCGVNAYISYLDHQISTHILQDISTSSEVVINSLENIKTTLERNNEILLNIIEELKAS